MKILRLDCVAPLRAFRPTLPAGAGTAFIRTSRLPSLPSGLRMTGVVAAGGRLAPWGRGSCNGEIASSLIRLRVNKCSGNMRCNAGLRLV